MRIVRVRMLAVLVLLGVAVHGSAAAQGGAATGATESPRFTTGGQVREQYELFSHEEWGSRPPDGNGYSLQRYMFHVDVRASRRVRLFGELKSGLEFGRASGPRPPDADHLDLHQAYADGLFGAATVRIGRQELVYGSARLLSPREGPNVRQTFDAARLLVHRGTWQVNGFAGWAAKTATGIFDDTTDTNRAVWGVYGVRQPGRQATLGVDVYYLGYRRGIARFEQGRARELRHSFGTRLWRTAAPLDYNVELVGQFGRFGSARILGWTVASDTGFRLSTKGRPRLGVRADITSGDRDRTDDRLGTFNPLFPRGGYFGLIAATGPANHRDLHPQVTLALRRNATLTAGWLFFWRDQPADGLYGIAGNMLRSGAGTRSRFVGHSPDVESEWQLTRRLSAAVDVSLFTAGAFIRESGPGFNMRYLSGRTTYRF